MSTAVNQEHDAHAPSANCPNCEAVVSGHFCANCGQEAILHHASTREFLHEFIGHYVALEGKLWGTVMRLLFRPGALTLEYIRGRRVRFVQPLRLYLTLSLVFFALMKLTSGFDPGTEDKESEPETEVASATAEAAPPLKPLTKEEQRGKAAAEAAIGAMQEDFKQEEAAVAAERSKSKNNLNFGMMDKDGDFLNRWPTLKHKWQAFEDLPGDQKGTVFTAGFYHYAPYAIFCLMPVFALMLKVLYLGSGKRFGEHLLFALHSNAFAFFIYSVILVMPFGFVNFVLWCWLLGYLPWAMRRVYGGSRWGVFLRWGTLMTFYSIAIGVAVLLSMMAGIMSVGAH
ncbi:DUF3667 domain-containing protein [Duganella sp. BJB488]|uniref:DUF3667 domain-containing protein n=1 Tax=unclassified Duganella TaxID=2636909 RepID=UPI000E357CAE|nr:MULTISPECIES: DUF3667 domain-containing protein [unclassified Duganella]RFP16828.1 DUF3667 domain-containing protein [Duganella sp. BJB489]RFP20753.1 DUF3667 domain-containing protein [Duganella sp. BJB488]RFP32190.1 DUF3667 domain-containing protein [Duganella sp. BJB480]